MPVHAAAVYSQDETALTAITEVAFTELNFNT